MSTSAVETGLFAPRSAWRAALARLRSFATRTQPPPAREQVPDRVVYGLAQPLLGLRLLFSDSELLRDALVPAAWLGAFCAVAAAVSHDGVGFWGWVKSFYKTFAVLAPVPSIIFAKHYARLAATVRWRLGFGPCGPREYSIFVSGRRALQQAIVIAIGVLPFAAIWYVLPFLGALIANTVIGAWGVHWVVVDAFDDARVLFPGETVRSAEAADRMAPPPWFVRWFRHAADKLPIGGRILRAFARLCDRLSLPWRGEIALVEAHPAIALGFAMSTATLLATPVLNLLFRPTILVGSSHLLGHLEQGDPKQHPQIGAQLPLPRLGTPPAPTR
ncbi:MAG TPA: hypothetical protein VG496_17160 [Myxococcales bacterium]|nr:hypothetical protein [Myxococcales bacterium]